MPSTLAKTAEVSIHVFCFTAANTPNKTPMTVAKSIADKASVSVPGKASNRIEDTSLLLEVDRNVKIRIEKSGISAELTQAIYGKPAEEKKA